MNFKLYVATISIIKRRQCGLIIAQALYCACKYSTQVESESMMSSSILLCCKATIYLCFYNSVFLVNPRLLRCKYCYYST